jgi:hypothetical protein
VGLGFELRASCSLVRLSTTCATPPAQVRTLVQHFGRNVKCYNYYRKQYTCRAPVANTCNPSYSGDQQQEDYSFEVSLGK